jgi:hypothetical protein
MNSIDVAVAAAVAVGGKVPAGLTWVFAGIRAPNDVPCTGGTS